MEEIYPWVEDQRRENSRRFYEFLNEQRQYWTPPRVFNRCCVKWTADGNYENHEYEDEYSCRNGCEGRCGQEHPRIVLDFDAEQRTTTATMSHDLAPFRAYFQERLDDGTACPQSAMSYGLSGFLRENQTKLKAQVHFGSHLVSVPHRALEASDAAYILYHRAAKRTKVAEQQTDPTPFGKFEEVMEVVVLERLQEDLDMFSIFCLRRTSKFFRRLAESIATKRLKSAQFSITPLVNGMERFGEDKFDGYDSESWEILGYPAIEVEGGLCQYTKRDKVIFRSSISDDTEGKVTFYPVSKSKSEFAWQSDSLYENESDDEDVDEDDYGNNVNHYRGQKLRVYWQPEAADGLQVKQRWDMMNDSPLPSLGVQIGDFDINRVPSMGLKVMSHGGVTVEFEVLASSETQERYGHIFSGRVRIVKLKVDFGSLVRQHAVRLEDKTRSKYEEIERERPLKESEKTYLNEILSAMRPIPS